MKVFPNPFVDNIKVFMTSKEKVIAQLSILSMDGKRVSTQQVQVEKGENIVVLQRLAALPKGNYYLEVRTGNEKYVVQVNKN